MIPMEIEELSALLDGELSTERAAEVRARITADPIVREEYEALLGLDSQLWKAAEAALFMPDIPSPAKDAAGVWRWPGGVAAVLALLAVRFLPKFIDVAVLSTSLQLAVGAAILVVIIRLVQEQQGSSSGSLIKGASI